MTDERYVAFADVLGFRELVKANTHDVLMAAYDGAFKVAADYAAAGGRASPKQDGEAPTLDVDLSTVNMRLVSDSVLMWTDTDRPPEFVALVMAVANLLAAGVGTGVPMRAAIAWGPVTHRRVAYDSPRLGVDALVGRALVDAYEAESQQQWSGGYVIADALSHYGRTAGYGAPTVRQLETARWLRSCQVPLKDHKAVRAHAIEWTRPLDSINEAALRNAFIEWNKSDTEQSTVEKMDNTVAFARGASNFQ